jgi:hypothetical protein
MRRVSTCPGVSALLIGLVLAITHSAARSAVTCSNTEECDDGNVCTDDWCDPGVNECFHFNKTGSCDDGNACTQNDTCSGGVCTGTAINCDDGDSCTTDSCVGGVCLHDTSGCQCTENADCDDGNACTDDWCDPGVNECFHTNNTDPCDDGDSCTQNDACSGGVCAGTVMNCDDGIACTIDSCVDGICQHDASGCECAESADCDDGNVCTDDWCDPGVYECFHTNNTNSCDDGNTCTQNDTCSGGTCSGTNTCATQMALCAPAAGATMLMTCLALLALQFYARRGRS